MGPLTEVHLQWVKKLKLTNQKVRAQVYRTPETARLTSLDGLTSAMRAYVYRSYTEDVEATGTIIPAA
ncbi:hypothetical protein HPB48_020604 [Haemaphysalis longicornis]|uniref:Uncharacterized protein n=1 Tax=Haemaphysalis longicornis TaxID=44386 RepID=A0A9J6GX43_HAELO|nr:hypothetical protein HPB48_020604 [Haemaphysalis longicornis]